MKILIVSSYFPPHLGGLEIVAQNQAKYLAKQGEDVSVITSAVGVKKGVERHRDGYTLYRLPVFNFFEKQFKIPFPVFYPSFIIKSYRLVKSSDVVHIHDSFYHSSIVAATWAFILKKPLILTQHVQLSPYPQKIVNLVQRTIYRTAGRFVFHAASRITVVNSGVKDYLVTHNVPAEKIVKLPNGINIAQFFPAKPGEKVKLREKYKLPADKVIILFVGRFIGLKGFAKLLECSSSGYTIAFAGGDAPSAHKNDPGVVFLGRLNQEQVSEVYRCCDAFILPSDGEGFPLTLQEAMASGLPAITNDDPGYDIYKFDRGYIELIQPTIENIRKAINRLAANIETRNSMATYSRQFALKNFSVESNIKRLLKIYEEVAR